MITAQITETATKLGEQAGARLIGDGPLGVIVLLLFALLFLRDFYFDRKRDEREKNREEGRAKEVDRLVTAVASHDEARDRKQDRIIEAVNDLVQSNLIETLSRPHLLERARGDAEALRRKVSQA